MDKSTSVAFPKGYFDRFYNNNNKNNNNNNIQVLGAFNKVSMLLQVIINKYKK